MRRINAFSSILIALFVFAITVVVAIRGRQEYTTPPATKTTAPSAMDVRPVVPRPSSRKEQYPAAISASIATLCGADLATSDRYEATSYLAAIFAQLSRSVEVRLKTGAPGVESTGSGKK